MLSGFLYLDGRPCLAGDVLALHARLPQAEWDQTGVHVEGSLGLTWLIRWTTPEAERETQPIVSSDGRYLVAYSGRIDNRDELTARYRALPGATDGALVAAALARDGDAGFRMCVGDFAVAAWDRVERRLLLARDAIGQRPFFYARRGRQLFWSTDVRVLHAAPGIDAAPNEGFFAEYLSGTVATLRETPFAGIERVPPAHVVSVDLGRGPASLNVRQYWIPPLELPRRRSDGELIEECRAQLTTATRACLRAREPVAIQLSGGLDSSSIVALARELTGEPPDTYSRVYPGQPFAANGEMLDETPFIDVVVAATGARSTRCSRPAVTRDELLRVLSEHGQIPDLPNGDASSWPLMRPAAAAGRRVMLTGLGGDQWLTGTIARIPAMLGAGRWRDTWRFLREAHGPSALEFSRRAAFMCVLAAGTPRPMKRAYRRLRPVQSWPRWVRPEFVSRTHLRNRLRQLTERTPEVRDDVLQESLVRLFAGGEVLAREGAYRTAADAGLELRHPFFDRRFVEFALTLPDDLRFRGGETRYVLRRALGADLPPEVATRRNKSDLTAFRAPAIESLAAGVDLSSLRVAAAGWVDPLVFGEARAAYLKSRLVWKPDDYGIWTVFAAEAWLRAHGPQEAS